MNNRFTKFLFFLILILALGLRIYKLDLVPPSISWDEAAAGVNGWTIANYGRDEYGKIFPFYFRSFGDDKHPVHFYVTSVFVKILGLNEFSTRLPSAIFGVFCVYLIFFIGRILFNSTIGLSASFFLAISPYNLHFSRFNHEANFALFFFLLGILLFYLFVKNNRKLLPWSVLSFGISFITYHPSKVVIPTIMVILIIVYGRKIFQDKTGLLISIIIIIFFSLLFILNPALLGIARANQTSLGKQALDKTKLFNITNNEFLGRVNLILIQYSWHFSPEYLFTKGDKNPRLSFQTGEFYKIDALFLITGLFYLLYKRSKAGLVVLVWAFIAPLPSALVAEAPHAARASFMMGSWHLISALGIYFIFNLVGSKYFKVIVVFLTLFVLVFLLKKHLNYYFGEYAQRYAIDWQYGMKQIVEYVRDHNEYNQIFMTDARSQPYIFFLYYLKTPLPEYLNSVFYNNAESKSHNNVAGFNKYYFGGWDVTESLPTPKVLYIVTPSQYDGLKHKSKFDVKKIVYYPNSTTAFYLVGAYE